MKRLLASIWWDIQLQWRYGFYYAGGFVVVIWIGLLNLIPATALTLLIPPLFFINLIMTTFYFMGGLVLLEKGQRTLEGLVVTPLKREEYLTAKAISLTLLALLESGFIIGLGYGLNLNWLWLILGLILLAAVYVLFGFVAVSRFDSINEYILPSALFVTVLTLPLLDYFGIWQNPVLYLIPTQPALILLRGAFEELLPWQAIYALGFGGAWIGIGYLWSRKVFSRFIVQYAG